MSSICTGRLATAALDAWHASIVVLTVDFTAETARLIHDHKTRLEEMAGSREFLSLAKLAEGSNVAYMRRNGISNPPPPPPPPPAAPA